MAGFARILNSTKLNIQVFYNSIAEQYSRDENPKFRDDIVSRPLIVKLAKYHGTNKRIFDVGCGDGHISRLVSPFAKSIVGLDISPSMLDQAELKTQNFENVNFVKGNFLNLPSALKRKFDVALCIYSFCCIDSPQKLNLAFRNIHSSLSEKGIAIVQIPDETEQLSESKSLWMEDAPFLINEIAKPVRRRLKTIDDEWVNVARYHYRQRDYEESIKNANFRVLERLTPSKQILGTETSAEIVAKYPSLAHELEIPSSIIYVLEKR
jgi:ubiquinone/menaquinone biosynthesis C-methylase UbiE